MMVQRTRIHCRDKLAITSRSTGNDPSPMAARRYADLSDLGLLCRAATRAVRQKFNQHLADDPSRPASLLLGCIRQVCALVAPCRTGGSSANCSPTFLRAGPSPAAWGA